MSTVPDSNDSLSPPPSQPPLPPTRPSRLVGWVLFALVVGYFMGIWFLLIDPGTPTADGTRGTGPLGTIGGVLFFAVIVVILALDFHGFVTLLGLITWGNLSGGKRFWLVCAFVFVFPIMFGIYLVRGVLGYYHLTQQRPADQLRAAGTWYKSRSRKVQAGLAAGTLLALIAFCSVSGVALGQKSANDGSSSNSSQTLSAPTSTPHGGTTVLATAAPAATHAPTATPTPSYAHFGDGAFQVGKDIQPGTYRTREGSPGCYWERLKGFSGSLDDIIANDNTDNPAVVTIAASDKGFQSQNCGTWTKDLSQITQSKTTFGDGTYIVGTDITPGTYKSSGSQGCYYARLSGFGGTIGDIIANNNTDNPAIVTISASDKGFLSNNCGTWTRE